MKIEIRCSTCGEAYLVDESKLPRGAGPIPCVLCGATIELSPEGAATSIQEPARRRAPETAPDREPGGAAAPRPTNEEVVCPRCNLHFVPRRAHARRAAAEEAGAPPRPRVLVVEDMDYFLEVASDALSEIFEVRTAKTLADARRIIDEGDLDLMIIDLTLEGGEEGLSLLASLRPKRFPVLVFTAQDEAEMYGDKWDELQRMGADDLVLKGMKVGEALLRKSAALVGIPLEDDTPED